MGAGTGVGELFVEQWLDLRRLPLVLDDLGEQASEIVGHAVRWVARRDGFEPSPLCLLRPLAGAMDRVGEAFGELGEDFGTSWRELRAAVAAADQLLRESDAGAHEGVSVVAGRLAGLAA